MFASGSEPLGAEPGGRGFSKGTLKDECLGDSTKVLSAFTLQSSDGGFASTVGGKSVAS